MKDILLVQLPKTYFQALFKYADILRSMLSL